MIAVVTSLLLLVGSTFALLAAVGILRLPDVFMRMQASAKASTLGLACLLIGTAFQLPDVGSFIRLASIQAFLMLTAPLAAHVVARASFRRGTPLWEGTVVNEHPKPDVEPASSKPRGEEPTPPTAEEDHTPQSGEEPTAPHAEEARAEDDSTQATAEDAASTEPEKS